GDIASSGTIGWDTVQLSEVSSDLNINTDIRLSGATPTIMATGGTNAMYIDMPGGGKSQNFRIRDSAQALVWGVSNTGDVSFYGDIHNLQSATGTTFQQNGSVPITWKLGGGTGYFQVTNVSSEEVFRAGDQDVSVTNNLDVGGNVTVSGIGDFGDTITAGGTTPEIQFSATSGTIGVSGNIDLIQLTGADVTIDGDLYCDNFYTSSVRAGRDTVASGVDNHTVAFVYNFVNTDYTVSVNLANTVDTPPSLYSSIITSTTVSGFSVLFSGD
ncbi:unnamed protein product, partial [marine sediment metagenome]